MRHITKAVGTLVLRRHGHRFRFQQLKLPAISIDRRVKGKVVIVLKCSRASITLENQSIGNNCGTWSRQLASGSFVSSGREIRWCPFFTKHRSCFLSPRYASASLIQAESFHSSSQRLKKRQPEEASPRELDLLRYDLRELKNAPKPALYLGFSGLVPFVFPPLLMAITETYIPELAYAQVVYGASVVSFLGGARWGFALPESSPAKPDWLNLANSVVPSLMAWVALLFSHSIIQSGMIVIIGLGISLHYDLALLPTYPSWFKAMRTILTTVAFFSLLATIVLKSFYPEKSYLNKE
ncbi:Transmembrane protein 69 [Bagarius yarrelli]|uniref:Transmembrane protein 69 n=1 Tax=Bagarius yarrelli TaxID=175774 RepID=A0A556TY33_BAGYA|nr:Transmembrane protein 69 [Bagarius yarrelli]